MAKVKMQKIEMIALLKDSKSIMERLQRRGVVEIYKTEDSDFLSLNTNSIIAQFERNMLSAQNALEILNRYSKKKDSLLQSLNGRRAVSTDKFGENKELADKTFNMCCSILDCSKKISDSNNEVAKLQTQKDQSSLQH